MEQTNILTKSDKVCGKELGSAAKIESKFKTATIIVMIALFVISLFISIPDDENYWLVYFLILLMMELLGWEAMNIAAFFKLLGLAKVQYCSYINETKASDILPVMLKALAAKGINASPSSRYEATINVVYNGRDYFVSFFNKGGGYFNVGKDNLTLHGFGGALLVLKYKHALEDIPIIAYTIQDTLKNSV